MGAAGEGGGCREREKPTLLMPAFILRPACTGAMRGFPLGGGRSVRP